MELFADTNTEKWGRERLAWSSWHISKERLELWEVVKKTTPQSDISSDNDKQKEPRPKPKDRPGCHQDQFTHSRQGAINAKVIHDYVSCRYQVPVWTQMRNIQKTPYSLGHCSVDNPRNARATVLKFENILADGTQGK